MELAKRSESGLRRWGTSLAAGATVVVCLMPVDMLYGVAVMSSLGAMAGPLAIWSAFMSMALANLFLARAAPGSALFGGVRPAQTVLAIGLLLAVSSHPRLAGGGLSVALATLVLAVGTAGVFQWLIGLFRLGRVIKFIHFPVLAGIVNGSAIALGWMALKDVLGLPGLAALGSALSEADLAAGLRLLLLLGLLALMHAVARRGWRLHWSAVGLMVGTALYQFVPLLLPAAWPAWPGLGGTLPAAPELDIRPLGLMGLTALTSAQTWWDMLRLALPVALTLSVINSIDTLISLAYLETLDGKRIEPNRVLRHLGLANLLAGLLGGLPVAPSNGRILIGFQSGARDWRGPAVGSVAALLLIAVLPQVVDLIPRLVASAIMVYLAWTLIDAWSKRSVGGLLKARTPPTLRSDLLLMVFVALMVLVAGIIPAIALGLLAAAVLFVMNNARSVASSLQRGSERRSLVVRTPAEEALLAPLRDRIVLVELNGSLFFGTADAMRDDIEAKLRPGDVLVLGFRRVKAIDASGARALASMQRTLQAQGVELFLGDVAGLEPAARAQLLAALEGTAANLRQLPDADRALQAAEDFLLADRAHELGDLGAELPLGQSELLRDLSALEAATLEPYFTRHSYPPEHTIFSAGQGADVLYVLTRGEVEIALREGGRTIKRLGLFRPGVVFGEMGLLLAMQRSADATARTPVSLLALSAEALERLRTERPELAFKLMESLARHLASRLAISTSELRFALRG